MTGWRDVWAKQTPFRPDDSGPGPTIGDLISADGFNTGFGDIGVEAWVDVVTATCTRFGLAAGDSLFDVGCGAGAFLQPAHDRGIEVAGLDYSPTRIELARKAMPGGHFVVGEAADLDPEPPVDVVLSFSVFQYFASLDEAASVIERMCRKASRAVAVYDLPDVERADEALALREESAGGAQAYAERYAGLDHLAFSRDWMTRTLESNGLRDVSVEGQAIPGYENASFRFNTWGWAAPA